MNILLVCTGNTCRSPMAEGILKQLLPNHGISSAGLMTSDGLPASANAIEASVQAGVDIAGHKSRRITPALIEHSDLILCMTAAHKAALSDVKEKYFTLGEYAGTSEEVPDPYGSTLDDYIACFNRLDGLLKKIAERIEHEDYTL